MLIDYERDRRNDIKSYREEGRLESQTKFVRYLIRTTTLDNREIASETGVAESVVQRARSEMILA